MTTDPHPTTAPVIETAASARPTRRRLLAGLGVTSVLAVLAVGGAGLAAAEGPTAATPVVDDVGTTVVIAPTTVADQEFNQRTGLIWDDEAGTWMFTDTAAETGAL